MSRPLQQLTGEWLKTLKQRNYARNTLEAYERDLSGFIGFVKEHLQEEVTLERFAALDITDVRAWMAYCHGQDFQGRSVARMLSSLRAFCNYLIREEYCAGHVLLGTHAPRLPKTLPRPLPKDQVLAMIEDIGTDNPLPWAGLRDRAVLMLLYATGMRISEAVQLNHGDLAGLPNLRILGKGGKFRYVPVLPAAGQALQEYLALCPYAGMPEEPLFFGNRGKRLHRTAVAQTVQKYRDRMLLPPRTTPHAMRHSCATHLLEDGGELRAIQTLLGHASLTSTQIYTKVCKQQMRNSYERFHPRGLKKPDESGEEV